MTSMDQQSAIAEAIKKGGGVVAMAKAMDVTREAVRLWRVRGVPAKHLIKLEEVTGVPREKLRPDLYRHA